MQPYWLSLIMTTVSELSLHVLLIERLEITSDLLVLVKFYVLSETYILLEKVMLGVSQYYNQTVECIIMSQTNNKAIFRL